MSKRLLSLVAASLLGLGATAASAAPTYLDFTIQEGAVDGTPDNLIRADKITGGYNEAFVVTGANTFSTSAYWSAGQFFSDEGANNVADSQDVYLGSPGAAGYGLYALFYSAGTFTPLSGGASFSGATGQLFLYIDANKDTGKSFNGGNPLQIDLTNTTDDYLIASTSTLLAGEGSAVPGLANGNFDLVFGAFTLENPGGTDYFIDPNPFHLVLDVSGQFVNFEPNAVNFLNGSADGYFTVPEPGSLALAGLALAGLSFGARRRKN